MLDTGSSAGEITGHAKVFSCSARLVTPVIEIIKKVINAVSIRHQRPFRAVTASDDSQLTFFHGQQ
jgi:WD repeat-containing protein 1 (actin-interacting protein 1)